MGGGPEFQDCFEEECQRRGIKLFVLPPRSPKFNGHVERAQRRHTEEFYEVTNTGFEIAELNQALLEWEKVYNTVRPHEALGYLTPQEFLSSISKTKERRKCHQSYERVQPLDCEGWDCDIIGDKLLDIIGSPQFLLVPKGIQPDPEWRLMHHAKNCFRGY